MKTIVLFIFMLTCLGCEKHKIVQTIEADIFILPKLEYEYHDFLGVKISLPYVTTDTCFYFVKTTITNDEYYDAWWFKSLYMADSISKIEYRQAINYLRKKQILDSLNKSIKYKK